MICYLSRFSIITRWSVKTTLKRETKRCYLLANTLIEQVMTYTVWYHIFLNLLYRYFFILFFFPDPPKIDCDNDKLLSNRVRNFTLTCRIKANPPIRPSSIQWQYDAFIPISQTSNVSHETSKDNLLHYVRQDESKMPLGNNTTSYDSKSNNIITTSVNETLSFNQNRTVVINTEPPTVWKFVEGVTTKTGTSGFTIDTHVSCYQNLEFYPGYGNLRQFRYVRQLRPFRQLQQLRKCRNCRRYWKNRKCQDCRKCIRCSSRYIYCGMPGSPCLS